MRPRRRRLQCLSQSGGPGPLSSDLSLSSHVPHVYEESARHRLPLLPRDLPQRLADDVDGHADVGRDLREGGV